MSDIPEELRKAMEEAAARAINSTPIPRKPYCIKCGPVDERIGIIGISGDFLCPKCGLVLNSRRS
jgi:hypothetical protein